MLINYDLYDIHALIVFFRQNTEKLSHYEKAVRDIISCIDHAAETGGGEANSVRRVLMPFVSPDEEQLSWALTENIYTANVAFIKNRAYYAVLSRIFREILSCGNDCKRLYLLCDAVHNIPLLLADEKKPKKAVCAMIKDYRKEYSGAFLENELKLI